MNSYVVITSSVREELEAFLSSNNYSKICIIADENTSIHCLPSIKEIVAGRGILITIKSGEESKNLQTCQGIWEHMTTAQMDRKSLVINLGGGVIGDMGGFCASTYKRGIDFIQIPTTLLSQVDASVGGKLGIDFTDSEGNVFKNHIGVFNEPARVIIDTAFLASLEKRELRSGFAEIIKHCLIADRDKWEELRKTSFELQDWNDLAAHSVEIKKKITEADPNEKGLRKILNFGHTLGHAIESFYLQTEKKLLHGEAIAIGMICESYLSIQKNYISTIEFEQISKYILATYDKINIPEKDIEKIIPLTLQDKKNEDSAVQFSLLKQIGEANFNIPIDVNEMKEAILHYNSL